MIRINDLIGWLTWVRDKHGNLPIRWSGWLVDSAYLWDDLSHIKVRKHDDTKNCSDELFVSVDAAVDCW